MKLLFCNEGPLYKDEKGNYYGSALSEEFFKKYYTIADFITICIRVKKISEDDAKRKMSRLYMSNKEIVELPNLMSVSGLLYRRKVKKILENEIKKVDLVVVRVPSMIGDIAARICKKNKKVYLADVVGCPWDSLFNYSLKGKIMAYPMYLSQKKTVQNADFSIYVTDVFLQKRYPSKKRVIGLSDVLLEDAKDELLKRRLEHINNNNGKLIIGTCAAINVKYKGQHKVIKALSVLKKDGINNIEYQLVGGGDTKRLLNIAKKYNVENQVKIIGSLPHEKVFNWLDSIDVYIQPSFQEGLCRALIEAMSRGLPCIASDVGGNPELISEEWIYNRRKSVKEIVSKIKNINNDTMIKMSKENFNNSKKYQKKVLEKKRKNFYDKIKTNMKIK